MTDYFYDMDLVVDPLNPSNVVANGSVAIYDPADVNGTTLLALKDPTGLPLPNPLTSNAHGFLPPRIAQIPQTLWKSGGFEGYFNSYKGLRDEAVLAVEQAEAAANSAFEAAGEAVSVATVNPEGNLILTKVNGGMNNAGSVKGPKGDKGDPGAKGADGANVLPTDTAIKDAIVTPGTQSRAALDAEFANKRAVRVGTRKRFNAAPVKHMVPACGVSHGWVGVGTAAATNLNDTSDFLLGTQSCHVTTNGAAANAGFNKTLAAPIDASDCDARIWVKFDSMVNLGNIIITLWDGAGTTTSALSSFGGGASSSLQWPYQENRWNILDVPQGAGFSNVGVWSSISRVQVTANDRNGQPINFRFGGVAFTKRDHRGMFPNGVASITFDDSFASAYTYARAKMDLYGYKGTLFPIIDRIGMADKLTLPNIQAMYQNGWEVAGHAFTNTNHAAGLPGLSAANRAAELENIKAWMDANGFQSPSYAYPLGNHDAASEADVAAFFDLGRLAFTTRDTPQAIAQPYALQAVNVGSQKAALLTHINRAVASKGWLNLVVHDIKASGAAGNDINQADFDQLLADLAASGIAVRTMGEVVTALN